MSREQQVKDAIRKQQLKALRLGDHVEVETTSDFLSHSETFVGTVANIKPENIVLKVGRWNVAIPMHLIKRVSKAV